MTDYISKINKLIKFTVTQCFGTWWGNYGIRTFFTPLFQKQFKCGSRLMSNRLLSDTADNKSRRCMFSGTLVVTSRAEFLASHSAPPGRDEFMSSFSDPLSHLWSILMWQPLRCLWSVFASGGLALNSAWQRLLCPLLPQILLQKGNPGAGGRTATRLQVWEELERMEGIREVTFLLIYIHVFVICFLCCLHTSCYFLLFLFYFYVCCLL